MTVILSEEQSPNKLTHARPKNKLTEQHSWLNMKLAGGIIPAIHHFSFIVLSYLGRDHPIFRHGEMEKMIETTRQGLSECLFEGMGAKSWRYHVFSSKLISCFWPHSLKPSGRFLLIHAQCNQQPGFKPKCGAILQSLFNIKTANFGVCIYIYITCPNKYSCC